MRVQVFSQMGALLEPLAAHGARISAVATMHSEDVGLDVAVPRKELEADAAGVLVADLPDPAHVGVLVVLLVLMCLQHHSSLDRLVAGLALVRRVQIFVVGGAGQIVYGVGKNRVLLVLPLLAALLIRTPRGPWPDHDLSGLLLLQLLHLLRLQRRRHRGRLRCVDHLTVFRREHGTLSDKIYHEEGLKYLKIIIHIYLQMSR